MPEIKDKSNEGASSPTVAPLPSSAPISVDQFTKDGFKVLMEATRNSNSLPTGRDWNFYNVTQSFPKFMNEEGGNILRQMNRVMQCNDIESNIRSRIMDEKMELVIEANDAILEKVANNVDEMNGIRKTVAAPVVIQTVSAELPINGSWNRASSVKVTVNASAPQAMGKQCFKLITAKNIVRPQKFFKDKIDNSNERPWCPRITDKPNSIKPLAVFLEEDESGQEFSHPYEIELDRFAPTPEQLRDEPSKLPPPLSQTPLIEIDKPEQLDELLEALRKEKEFAVDLEHHSYRTFMGITCLLQISTKNKDYIIDTLALRDRLHVLNEVFTRNSIVKIFHGADKDIEWLQRDLSLYVVNMFDTHQAARVLEYSSLSLAFLLKKFCNVVANKQFQLADWRIRPLPNEFKTYAREDTHYLIHIYKMLKKELLVKGNRADNLLRSVIERSTAICKKRYFKPVLQDDSHMDIYRRCKKLFDNRQLYALKEIYAWRDKLAREEDESLAYVLPSHMLLQISETLPREMQGILACCNPIPPLVRSHLLELHQIVLRAREQPLEKAILKDTTGPGVLKRVSKLNLDSFLHCPHDLSKTQEIRDDLPTLLGNSALKMETAKIVEGVLDLEKGPSYSVFGHKHNLNLAAKNKKPRDKMRYFSPFERYKMVKPIVELEEKAAEARKQAEKEDEHLTKAKASEDKISEDGTRTDEDRIASVRDHFLQLSKKFSEELAEKQKKEDEAERIRSLAEMGGSRKRKRDFDDGVDGFVDMSHDRFDDPIPNLNLGGSLFNRGGNKGRARKRKHDEIEGQVNSREQGSGSKKKKKNKNRNQQQLNQGQNQQQQMQQNQNRKKNWNQQQNQGRNQREQKEQNQSKKKNWKQQQNQKQEQDKQQSLHNQNQKNNNNNKNRNRGNQQNQGRWKNPSGQNDFVPYDYASVDFRQFQGGAGSATGGVNFKSNFKAKGKKKINKKGAKSAIFGTGGNKDRGKGQGRHQQF